MYTNNNKTREREKKNDPVRFYVIGTERAHSRRQIETFGFKAEFRTLETRRRSNICFPLPKNNSLVSHFFFNATTHSES